MADAVLARRLSRLRPVPELARPATAERHLDRLLGRGAERAGDASREAPRP